MASPSAESSAEPPVVTFRPNKKRKAYRQRAEDVETEPAADATPLSSSDQISALIKEVRDDVEDQQSSVSEVLRLRNARKSRLGGVAFRAGSTPRPDEEATNAERNLVPAESGENQIVGGIRNRFAPQTGLTGELVNKHMEEYIEAELAKRQRQRDAAEAAANGAMVPSTTAGGSTATTTETSTDGRPVVAQQPAMTGKLMEIDLGDEARSRNVAETERARRRLEGESYQDDGDGRPKKVRLGRDGKPWHSRNRRNSEDIKRDKLVEEFLAQNSLDVYERPAEPQLPAGATDTSADDAIAEEFRREFMDAMMQRQQRKRPAANAKPVKPGVKGATEEVLKGPKLGGSRNQRAAMRDILLKQQEGKR